MSIEPHETLTHEAKAAIRDYLLKIFLLGGSFTSVILFAAGFFIRDVAITKAQNDATKQLETEISAVRATLKKHESDTITQITSLKDKLAKQDEILDSSRRRLERGVASLSNLESLIGSTDNDKIVAIIRELAAVDKDGKSVADKLESLKQREINIDYNYRQYTRSIEDHSDSVGYDFEIKHFLIIPREHVENIRAISDKKIDGKRISWTVTVHDRDVPAGIEVVAIGY